MRQAQSLKSSEDKESYRKYLQKLLQHKEMVFLNLTGQQTNEEGRLSGHESMAMGSDVSGDPQGHHAFQVRSSKLRLHDLEEKKKHIRSEIFLLKSQLSSLDSK
jgi:hypothetical protein